MTRFRKWYAVVSLLALAACAVAPAPVDSPQTFHVVSASARFVKPGERQVPLLWLETAQTRFPSGELGLSRAQVQRDVAQALMQAFDPASRGGEKPVTVRYDIYGLTLPGGAHSRNSGTSAFSYLTGWLQFSDSRTGEVLVPNVEFMVNPMLGLSFAEVNARTRLQANPVRSYKELLGLISVQAAAFLPRPK